MNDRECFLPLVGMNNVECCLVNSGALGLELFWKGKCHHFLLTIDSVRGCSLLVEFSSVST